MRSLQWALWGVGLLLQYAVLATLVRGSVRDFRAVFIYVFLLFATTITDIAAFYTVGRTNTFYKSYFWIAALARQSALFAVVVSLAMALVPTGRRRRAMLNTILALAVLFWAASLMLTHEKELTEWMTRVVRNLSFGSAVLDLCVWFALISTGGRDTRRLLIAGGLGLQMTGEAIGQSLRSIFPQQNTALASVLLTICANYVCLLIWWYALRPGNDAESSKSHSSRSLTHSKSGR